MKNSMLLLGLLFSQVLYGQFLENPSLEGPRGENKTPPGWQPCHYLSTPDTPPGTWYVNNDPSDGESYVHLVTRGNMGPYANTTEDMQAHLLQPLLASECYLMEIDLAVSENSGHFINWNSDFLSYYKPVNLKVYGSVHSCEQYELLAESGPVSNIDWKSYPLILKPDKNYNFLLLVADYVSQSTYFGNILIDNIRITRLSVPVQKLDTIVKKEAHLTLNASESVFYSWNPVTGLSCHDCQNPSVTIEESTVYEVSILDTNGCEQKQIFTVWLELIIPNVITPNNDQINDYFNIQGLRPNSKLWIFNRWGQEVFRSNNYQNNWDGKTKNGDELPSGVYYFVFEPSFSTQMHTGTITLIR